MSLVTIQNTVRNYTRNLPFKVQITITCLIKQERTLMIHQVQRILKPS